MSHEKSTSSKKLEVITTKDEDETCLTVVLNGEDHTLGNALRYMIMKNPKVKFCGYAIPHPAESKINVRIETYSVPSVEVLKSGLENLNELCDYVLQTFEDAVASYKQKATDVEMT